MQPRPQLRLALLEALEAALFATADTPARGVLLKSLLALGNSRDETLRQQLDGAMRQLVEAGHVDELINEVGRMESAVALQFLGCLANSADLSRKKKPPCAA